MAATHVLSSASEEICVASISVFTRGICFGTRFKVFIKIRKRRLEQSIFQAQVSSLFKAS